VWNAESQTKIHSVRGEVKALGISPDGTRIAYGGGDYLTENSLIRICDFTLGKASSPISILTGHHSPITSLAFSSDSKQLLSVANEIRVWDILDTTPVDQENETSSFISSLAFSPDGTRILSSSNDRICMWDAHLGTQVSCSHLRSNGRVHCLIFSPDGQRFASVASSHIVTLNGVSGEQLFAVQISELEEFQGHAPIAFSPDGNIVTVGLYKDIYMIDVLSGSQTVSCTIGGT
jgi:WD40 repeat protein